jgi:hypothetical protein
MSVDGRTNRWLTVVVLVLVLAPALAACISVIGQHWHAGGDQALELLRIRDVGTRHTPLVGAWSRWGWAHPGPVLFWMLAPFYRLFGETGVLVGMGVLNGLAIAGVVLVAHRRGGPTLAALAGVMVALLVRSLGVSLIVDIWNPLAAFFPFVLFLMLAWAVLCRDWAMLPIAVFVGSFVVQIHAGYLPLVVPLLLFVSVFAAIALVRSRRPRWLVAAGVVALVVWLPSLVQQMASKNGNLAALFSYIRRPGEATAGWTTAFGTFGAQFRPVTSWVDGSDVGLGFTAVARVWPAVLTLAAVVVVGLLAWRRRQRDAAWLAVVAVISVIAAVVATSKLTGPLFVYLTRWWWAVAAIATLAIVWGVTRLVGNRVLDSVVSGAAVVAMAVAGVMSASDLPVSFAHPDMVPAVGALEGPTARALDRNTRYLVERFDTSQLGFVSIGLFRTLDADGYHVFTPSDDVSDLQYGNWRVATPDDVDATISVVDTAESGWQPPPDGRLVASYDPLSPAQRARELELDAQVRSEMGTHAPSSRVFVLGPYERVAALSAGASLSAVDELATLQQRGDGFAVYVSPAP